MIDIQKLLSHKADLIITREELITEVNQITGAIRLIDSLINEENEKVGKPNSVEKDE